MDVAHKIVNTMRRYFFIIIIIVFLYLSNNSVTFASSNYVLPYPSAMPGSFVYKLELVKEYLMSYWYFGDFGQFKYNLQESDKYLVEAKTLFDYKQYLLGYQALTNSDQYFEKIRPSLISAQNHNKDISEKLSILKEAALKHIEELNKMRKNVPETFVWSPEKRKPSNLNLGWLILNSIKIRGQVL